MGQGMASETRTDSSAEQSTAAAKQAQRCSTLRPVFGQSRGARECDRTPEPFHYIEEGSRRGLRPPRGTFRAQCRCTPCALLSAKGTQGTCKARRADRLERRRFEHRHGMRDGHARRHGRRGAARAVVRRSGLPLGHARARTKGSGQEHATRAGRAAEAKPRRNEHLHGRKEFG
jgi:hypothetical protein